MTWEDISKALARGISTCFNRYSKLTRRNARSVDNETRLAALYEMYRREISAKIAVEMGIPREDAEDMHWDIEEQGMAKRAAAASPFKPPDSIKPKRN